MQISDLTIESPSRWARLKYFLDWPRLRAVSGDLSEKINELLDDPNTKINVDDYVLYLGDLHLWIANFPYYYGILHPGVFEFELTFQDPNSSEWAETRKQLDQLYVYLQKYEGRCPNSPTIWRLRQVELATRKLTNKLVTDPFHS
jgi:hypothetical protein